MELLSLNKTGRSLVKVIFICLTCFALKDDPAYAQNTAGNDVKTLVSLIDSNRAHFPIEKLYLHFDKPYYAIGDTIWFKAYLFDASFLTPSQKSGLFYIELSTDSNKVVKRMMVPAVDGLSWGSIPLNEKEFSEGGYTLRAYTNWMRNFNEDYVFKKQFYFAPERQDWLLHTQVQPFKGEGNRRLTFPLELKRSAQTDLQFMPEGGALVAGLSTRVGFKAIGEDGKGTDVTGVVYNSKQEKVSDFSSEHKGMGSFELTPQPGEEYTAKLIFKDGESKTYRLPRVNNAGTVLRINKLSEDFMQVQISASADVLNRYESYYLVGQARGVVCYAARLNLDKTSFIDIPKDVFPTGIARLTLLNASKQPLNERLVYIDHNDALKVDIQASMPVYYTKDSISLNIQVNDKDGKPISGSFSLAVTDDGQVETGSTAGSSIVSNVLLTSDLKGEIEEPGYYLGPDSHAGKHLDNLLLTQGWVGYNWKDIFNAAKKQLFAGEPEFTVQGRVTNAINRPVSNSQVTLLSKKPFLFMDTLTNADGRFIFKNFFPTDTAVYFIQAKNQKGNSFNVGIEVDEFRPPVFTGYINTLIPWYINTDTTMLNYVKKNTGRKEQLGKFPGANIILKEVVITARKTVKGSKNLNGAGNADQVLDEKDMLKAGKMTLGDLLQQKVKGFGIGTFPPKSNIQSYTIFFKEVRLVIDGIDVDYSFTPGSNTTNERLQHIKSFLDYYTAEDIKGIEVMHNSKYNARYNSTFLPPDSLIEVGIQFDFAYVEITTRSGQGPFLSKTPGVYSYRPMAFSLSKEFYRPRYTVKGGTASEPDLRSTIHWEPNIITDEQGKASVSFFAADQPGRYTIILQGSDMNGNLAEFRSKTTISSR
ncbi:hypothetical protein [Desertivirga xinjiangensis]|uniref:hypothetical protein n=1 Tax=Desertivirga xinjiangensis TaxID=539206 RepID=UPI00210D3BF5|nr:hypothetical protein [Pedobacter xinjiangensis]